MPDMRVLKTKARQSDRRQTPSFSWGKALCSCYIIPHYSQLWQLRCCKFALFLIPRGGNRWRPDFDPLQFRA